MLNDIKNNTKERMAKAIEVFCSDIKGVRTGRASASLLDGIVVNIYGGNSKLNQVAAISVIDNKTLSINVWDTNTVTSVKNAVSNSNLGLNPIVEGDVIRVALPELTEESRKKFIKLLHEFAENAKVATRNIRRDILDKVKDMKKNKEISEDDFHNINDEIQKITNNTIEEIDEKLSAKEKDILSI